MTDALPQAVTALATIYPAGPLASLEEACRLLAVSRDLGEILAIRDMFEAARLYARAVNLGLEAQNHAAEIKIRAERRAGELLAEMPKNPGGPVRSHAVTTLPTYEELGIERMQAHRWQQIASVPEPRFEAHIKQVRAAGRELSSAGVRSIAIQMDRVTQPVQMRPISVVDTDQEALETLLGVHAAGTRIVDVTHNVGRIWQGVSVRPLLRLDANPELLTTGDIDQVADFRQLPLRDHDWQVVVFDPPHLTDSTDGAVDSTASSFQAWHQRYGLGDAGPRGHNIVPLFQPFLREAKRVLVDGGIVIAKIANQVHAYHYQDQARAFKNLGEVEGFTHCDEMLRVAEQRGNLVDPRWQHIYHVRGVHTFWIVLRNSAACSRPHANAEEA